MKKVTLNKIIYKTKKYIFGDLLGNNSSKILGDGYDFAQISAYNYGDNIRRIDAYSSAKKNELHVRDFYESKEVNLHVIVCASGSLHFGSVKFKQEVIAEIIALLGLSAIKDAESFSLSVLSDKVEYSLMAKKTKNSVINAVDTFLNFDLKGKKVDYGFEQLPFKTKTLFDIFSGRFF